MSETTSEELIECGNCSRPTPPKEIREFHGTCQYCRRSMLTAHLNGKLGTNNPEHEGEKPTPFARITEDHYTGCALDEEGQRENFTEFDYAAIDRDLGLVKEVGDDARAQAAEVVRRLMVYCWRPPLSIRQSFARFAIVSAGLFPDVATLSFRQIAHALNCSKQNVSKAAIQAQQLWGLKFHHTRSDESRQRMRAKRLENPVGRFVKKRRSAP